jgi:hypothetical protein
MESVGIVLNIYKDKAAEFEQAFRENEYVTWQDYFARGRFVMATLSRIEGISTRTVDGAQQYLLQVLLADDQAHHEHDSDPRFKEWDSKADAYQIAPPFVFGGEVIISQVP